MINAATSRLSLFVLAEPGDVVVIAENAKQESYADPYSTVRHRSDLGGQRAYRADCLSYSPLPLSISVADSFASRDQV
jgi:hypothetical protein